jgi:hypothetical protein
VEGEDVSESEDIDEDEIQRRASRKYEEASESELRTTRGLLVEQARATVAQLRREERACYAATHPAPAEQPTPAPSHNDDNEVNDDNRDDDDNEDDDDNDDDDDHDDDDDNDDGCSDAGSVIHVAHVAPAAKQAVPDRRDDEVRSRTPSRDQKRLDKAIGRRPPRQRSPTPRGDNRDDEAYDEEYQDCSDADRPQEPAQGDMYDLREFTTWYLINMSGNTADCFFGGQRTSGGYTAARENHPNDFDTDNVIEGKPLPNCVERLFSGVYYDHSYIPLAKLVAYEIGSLSTSLNWIRQVQRQSYQEEEVLEAAFKELAKDQTAEGFWRFADKIRYKIEQHSKSRYGRKLKASGRWEPSIPQKRKKPLREQPPSPKKRSRLFNRPWWAADPSNPRRTALLKRF